MAPKISVCIPTYNYARYISFTIESILNQRFTDFELIVLDDCSKDNTEEVVSRFLHDKRVSFERNEKNLGLAGNWNKCLSKAKGEYIKFVFADDVLASDEALGLMAGVLDSDPSVSLVASGRHLIDSESKIIGFASHFPPNFVADGLEVINLCLKEDTNKIGEPTVVMFRRADCLRGFDERYQQLLDQEMWFHLLEKGRFAFIAQPLASFRIHPGQKTKENAADLMDIDDRYLLLSEYFSKPYCQLSFVSKFYMLFEILYSVRKYGKKGVITKEEVKRRIGKHCSYSRFWYRYVIYKLLRRLFRILGKPVRTWSGDPEQNPFGL